MEMINLLRSIVRSKACSNFVEKLVVEVKGHALLFFFFFQEACATAPSSCAPTVAASLRGTSVMGEMIVETGQMKGTVT